MGYLLQAVGILFSCFFCGMCILECLDKNNKKGALLWSVPVLTILIYLISVIDWSKM